MDEFTYFQIHGHYPIDPQSDIHERFAGDRIPPDWDGPSEWDREPDPNPDPEIPVWSERNSGPPIVEPIPILCPICKDEVTMNGDGCDCDVPF